uniref:Uncharacterized protein n=1 Tax=Steinernema glaseri TaxID=37863 RepID=A0A1I7ZBV8_9BILA
MNSSNNIFSALIGNKDVEEIPRIAECLPRFPIARLTTNAKQLSWCVDVATESYNMEPHSLFPHKHLLQQAANLNNGKHQTYGVIHRPRRISVLEQKAIQTLTSIDQADLRRLRIQMHKLKQMKPWWTLKRKISRQHKS